jgi:hypothetical protein
LAEAAGGLAVKGRNTGGNDVFLSDYVYSSTNTVDEVMAFQRETTGTAADGIGQAINFYTEAGGSLYYSGGIEHSYSSTSSRDSKFDFMVVNGSLTKTGLSVFANGSLGLYNNQAPISSLTGGVLLYSDDVSSSAELKVRDEAGNVTTLSPHNFTGIPSGRSEQQAWAYYSEKDGRYINVDMLRLARLVEKLSGEKLIYTGKTFGKPNPKNK